MGRTRQFAPSFLSYLQGNENGQELLILSNGGAGSCLFRAIAQHESVYGDERRHFEVRKRVCEHVLAHWNDYRSCFSVNYSQERFRLEYFQEHFEVGEEMLKAVSHCFTDLGFSIFNVPSLEDKDICISHHRPIITIHHDSQELAQVVQPHYIKTSDWRIWPRPSQEDVILLFTGGGRRSLSGHYELVVPARSARREDLLLPLPAPLSPQRHSGDRAGPADGEQSPARGLKRGAAVVSPESETQPRSALRARTMIEIATTSPPPPPPPSPSLSESRPVPSPVSQEASGAETQTGCGRTEGCLCNKPHPAQGGHHFKCLMAQCVSLQPFSSRGLLGEHVRRLHSNTAFNKECVSKMDLGFCEQCLHIAGTRNITSKHRCITSRPRVVDRTTRSQASRVQRLARDENDFSGPHLFEPSVVKAQVQEAWDRGCEVVRPISWERVFSGFVPTSSYVPPSLGFQNALSSLVIVGLASICVNSPSAIQDDSLKLFLLLAKILFGKCGGGKFPKKAEIRRRLALLLHGRLSEADTVRHLLQEDTQVPFSEQHEAGAESWRLKRAELLVSMGEIAKGFRTVSSDMVPARVDAEVMEELRRLHPLSTEIPTKDHSVTGVFDGEGVDVGFEKGDFTNALLGSARGLAAGPTGWRLEYLMALSHKGIVERDRVLDLLFKFSVLVCQGALPTLVGDYFFGGNLTPLRKPGGSGRGLRPVCVGEVFVRLIGRAITKHNASGFENFLLPLGQLGVATSAGAEAIVHSVRLASVAHPDWLFLQLDFRNAFNTISRSLIEQQLQSSFPSLLPYFYSRYGRATLIQVGDSGVIQSTSGVHQGDPVGPFFFALGLAAVMRFTPGPVEEAQRLPSSPSHTPSGLFLAYLDDTVVCGPPDEVVASLNSFLEAARALNSGLEINVHKSVLWSPSRSPGESKAAMEGADTSLLNISALSTPERDEGLVLLGAPIGSPTFVKDFVRAAPRDLESALQRVLRMKSTQCRVLLLRYCAVPKINFLLRVVPPSLSSEVAKIHDDVILHFLGLFQGFCSEKPSWRHLVSLPIDLGGVGLTSASASAPFAYTASVADGSRTFARSNVFSVLEDAVNSWLGLPPAESLEGPSEMEGHPLPRGWVGSEELDDLVASFRARLLAFRSLHPTFAETLVDKRDLVPLAASDLPTSKPKLQHRLTRLHHEMSLADLMGSSSPMIRSHVLGFQQRGAGAPYFAIPSSAELTLSNEVFRFFSYSRQCIRELEVSSAECSCRSGEAGGARPVGISHHHHCALGGGLVDRHDPLCFVIAKCARAAGFPTLVQCQAQGAREEYPDLVIHNFPTPGESAFGEVSVVCPSQDRFVREASQVPLHAASHREGEKQAKYAALAVSFRRRIIGLVMESTGAFGKNLQEFISSCAAAHDEAVFAESCMGRTWASSRFAQYWYQRIAIDFWRGSLQMSLAGSHAASHPPIQRRSVPRHRAHPLPA